jgi:hypothetical protein
VIHDRWWLIGIASLSSTTDEAQGSLTHAPRTHLLSSLSFAFQHLFSI